MTDYIELRIGSSAATETMTDLLAAFLADLGYESFVPDDRGLTAYIASSQFSADAVSEMLADFPMPIPDLSVGHTLVPGQDWNAEWEKHYFKPIIVGEADRGVVVHSSFHTDVPQALYDIVIDPKMAFGTGHHATTANILEYLLELPMQGRTVIDMGTGTGILAILCAMRGAGRVTGIEIDPGAWENAVENVAMNGVQATATMLLGDATALPEVPKADLFIANINRNIILADLPSYAAALRTYVAADMILSGFYEEDIPLILEAATPLGLTYVDKKVNNRWTALHLRRV